MEDSRIVELYWQKNADAIKETDSKYGAYCFAIADNIVGVIVLDIVIGVEILSKLPLPRLHFIVTSLLFGSEVSTGTDDVVKTGCNLIPVEFYRSAERLLQFHALTAVIFRAAAGYCMGTATGSVLVLQKGNFLFGVVSFGEIGIDTALAALHIPTARQSGVNFIFGDEHSQGGNLGHIRLVFASRERQIGKVLANGGDFVIVEAHEITIFTVSLFSMITSVNAKSAQRMKSLSARI